MIDLEDFVDGYIECALFASPDLATGDQIPEGKWSISDCENRAEVEAECKDFVEANTTALMVYSEHVSYNPSEGSPWSYAGHDFHLTRNGHGAGFWDRCPPLGIFTNACKGLTEASKVYGSDMVEGNGSTFRIISA